jgi:hypothetical protein
MDYLWVEILKVGVFKWKWGRQLCVTRMAMLPHRIVALHTRKLFKRK